MNPMYKVTETTEYYDDCVITSKDVNTVFFSTLYDAAYYYDNKLFIYKDTKTSSDMVKEFSICKNDKEIESFIVEQEEQA